LLENFDVIIGKIIRKIICWGKMMMGLGFELVRWGLVRKGGVMGLGLLN
jgi:hypothetical protein